MEVMNGYSSGQRLFKRCLLIVVLLTALSGIWAPGQAAPTRDDPTPSTPSGPTLARDRFGYEVATATPDTYIDASFTPKLLFDSSDDGFSGPVDIKFPFRFYENTYTTMFVSTNGLITFGRGDNAFVNRPIPYDTLPNNFIAPFWDDLSLGANGGVYVRYFGVVPGSRSVIIEWSRVLNAGNEITFEAILYESGNITFRYKTMAGPLDRSTIGIEDPEGLDGLQFVYNSAGLLGPGNVPYEIRFTRPAPFARVKVLPRNSSNFAINQSATFQMTVRNSGDAGPDTFDLTTQVSNNTKWRAQINSLAGGGLSDTNGNGIPDTGQIAAGQAVSISLVLRPNSGAGLVVGDYTNVVLRATSAMIPEAFITATVQTAVPVPFAQIYVDPNGIHLRQTWEKNIIDKDLTLFTGKTLAVRGVTDQDYLVAWEKRSDYYNFTEIEYQVVNHLNPVGKLQVLSNSQAQLVSPVVDSHAETPTIALAPNKQVGVVWSQRLVKGDGSFNTKIYLTFTDILGTRISDRFALTDDESFYVSSNAYNRFTSHNLVATADNNFFACWLLTQRFGDGTRGSSLKCGIYALNGAQLQTVVPPFTVDSVSGTGGVLYAPYLARLSDNRVLIVYNRSTGGSTQLVYSIWSKAGAQLAPTVLSGVVGSSPVGVQFANGNIMLAWADQSGQLGYAYLNGSFALQAGFPKLLPRVTQRAVAYPSLTLEKNGQAVVTWVDADTENSNYLYYLLLNQTGNITNPAMFFHNPIINTSTYGFGSAAYKGVYQVFLPFTNR